MTDVNYSEAETLAALVELTGEIAAFMDSVGLDIPEDVPGVEEGDDLSATEYVDALTAIVRQANIDLDIPEDVTDGPG